MWKHPTFKAGGWLLQSSTTGMEDITSEVTISIQIPCDFILTSLQKSCYCFSCISNLHGGSDGDRGLI